MESKGIGAVAAKSGGSGGRSHCFLRCQRIRRVVDFRDFRNSQRRRRRAGFLLVWKDGPAVDHPPRLALVTSRKVGNAVRRNFLRRIFREEFRLGPTGCLVGMDLLVIFSPESRAMAPRLLRENFHAALGEF
ncbi:MAG: ribonuclease P protein component [Puniceicoccales bacterium]|nr:ribonuclease P protein component [Puniceicoccales bacterium]